MKAWLSNISIRNRILVSTIVPLVIVASTLGAYMTLARLNDTEQAFLHHGKSLAQNLAVNSEFGVFANNRRQLEIDTNRLLLDADVAAISIFDQDGELLVRTRRDEYIGSNDPPNSPDLVVFNSPIRSSQVSIMDYPGRGTSGNPGEKDIGRVAVTLSRKNISIRQREIIATSSLVLVLGVFASILLSLAISRTVTWPLADIVTTVRDLQTGELGSRVAIHFGGELAQLADDINSMATTIQTSQQRLSQEVEQATADLKALVQMLEIKNQQLEQAREIALETSRTKSEFLASMSHEIRTPLSAVIGYSRLLENMRQTEEQQLYTRTIKQAATQLLAIIDDILSFTRTDSGKLILDKTDFDLHERLENIVNIQAAAAHEKQLELVLLIHTDVPVTINHDANRIGQILTNLIANAIKFTESGHIVIEVALKSSVEHLNMIEISVTDTGIGMSHEEATHVFLPFTQADATTSRRYGGTGLGLAISKQLVDLMGGRIGVSSTPGKGSRFWFNIPTDTITSAFNVPQQSLAGYRILVYDQNSFTRRALRNRLLSWGATVFVSSRWINMLNMIAAAQDEANPYQLLVLGLSVQEYGNRLVAEIIDDIRKASDIPILLLIGAEAQQLSPSALQQDHIKFISKPPRSEQMLSSILQLLAGDAGTSRSEDISPATKGKSDPRLAGKQVLVVEDNAFNRDLARRLLEALGISATTVVNGQEACNLASKQIFDLILMDLHMPGMGGIEASKVIHSGPNRRTPIIALSADVFANEQELAGSSIQASITKPVSSKTLADTLLRWLTPDAVEHTDHKLSESAGHEPLPEGMQQQLQAELHAQIAGLRSAIETADQDGLHDHLHQLKGISDYFQQADVSETCYSLQQALSAHDRPAILAALARLDDLLASRNL